MIPLINGETYTYSQIVFAPFGIPMAGITDIEYSTEQEKQDNWGAGVYAVNRGHGRKKSEASITIYMEELEALRRAAPNGDILDYPAFDIPITYLNTLNVVVNHVLKNVEFLKVPISTKSGDTSIPVTLPLIVSHILRS